MGRSTICCPIRRFDPGRIHIQTHSVAVGLGSALSPQKTLCKSTEQAGARCWKSWSPTNGAVRRGHRTFSYRKWRPVLEGEICFWLQPDLSASRSTKTQHITANPGCCGQEATPRPCLYPMHQNKSFLPYVASV